MRTGRIVVADAILEKGNLQVNDAPFVGGPNAAAEAEELCF